MFSVHGSNLLFMRLIFASDLSVMSVLCRPYVAESRMGGFRDLVALLCLEDTIFRYSSAES